MSCSRDVVNQNNSEFYNISNGTDRQWGTYGTNGTYGTLGTNGTSHCE